MRFDPKELRNMVRKKTEPCFSDRSSAAFYDRINRQLHSSYETSKREPVFPES